MPEFSVATWLAGVAVLLVACTLVIAPLLRRQTQAPAPDLRAELLRAQREAVQRARELDEDFRTGKLAEADYQRLRAGQIARGAELLQQLDEDPKQAESAQQS